MTDEVKDTKEPNVTKKELGDFEIAGINVRQRGLALWNGEVPLAQTFWIYYFISIFVMKVIGNAVGGPIGMIFGLLAIGWAGFMVMPILSAAEKYTGAKHWALAAKIAAVLIGLGVLINLFTG